MTTRALANDFAGAIVFEVMEHDLRVLLRWSAGRADQPTTFIIDNGTRQSTLERGHPRRLRRAQEAERHQDPCRGGHAG